MDDVFCRSCGISIDAEDNFCRRCGARAREESLPAVRGTSVPAIWRPSVSPAVKGAAVMAAGTVGQFLLRRAVGGIIGGGRSRNRRAIQIRRPRERDGMTDEAQIITETVMMRRVRIRRPS
jgi:hypothetical protein